MKNLYIFVLAAVCCMCVFTNCSDDEGPDVNLTPDENKQKLEDIGLSLLSKIDPADHKELIQTLQTFDELAYEGDLEIFAAMEFSQNVRQIVSRSDLGKFASYNAYESEIYQVKDYYGIYTYNERKEEWDYKSSNSKLEFIFPVNGKEAVITLSASGTDVKVDIDGDTYMVPPAAEGTIKRDNNELCKVSMTNTTNASANTVYLEATMHVNGGYIFYVKADLKEEKATAEASLKKNKEMLVYGEGEVTGKSMTNIDVIENTTNLEDLFKTADAYVQIQEDMNIKAANPKIKEMIKALDKVEYNYQDEKTYQEKRAKILNEYITAAMYYNGSNEVIATIEFQAYLDYDSGRYQYWEIEPVLVFRVDDSRHSFMDYFGGNNFSKLVNSIENLAKKYESYLK